MHGADCKIPDETGIETGTLQVVSKFLVTGAGLGENDAIGFRTTSLSVNSDTGNGPSTGTGANIQWAQGTVPMGIQWGNSAGETNRSDSIPGTEDIKAITDHHRVVSAALYVQPEMSIATSSGEMCLFVIVGPSYSPNYADYLNQYKTVTIPLNTLKGGVIRWYPIAENDWSFKSFVRTNGKTPSTDDNIEFAYPFFSLGFLADGTQGTNITFRVTLVINYEFIPKFNTLNVLSVSPSPSDAMEVDLVENWVQEMPIAAPINVNVASSSPSAVSPSHEDDSTGFGMFFNVIAELAPLALEMLI